MATDLNQTQAFAELRIAVRAAVTLSAIVACGVRSSNLQYSCMELIDVNTENLEDKGFFCYMSKRKSEGYQRKLRWLKERMAEGLRIKLLPPPERGFIEYMPGEKCWRAVHAQDYMVIHCLWVVGKSKSRGFGKTLLDACVAEAQRANLKGVAMVTSERVWLAGSRILSGKGFECVATAQPAFSLMAKKFQDSPSPSFTGEWDRKASAFGKGLTVIRSDQCPYIVDATTTAVDAAKQAGIEHQVVELESHDDLLKLSPSAYGVFGLVLDGKPLSYHYLLAKDLVPLLVGKST